MRSKWNAVWLSLLLIGIFSLAGCDSGSSDPVDAGNDGTGFDAADAGTDAGTDAGADPGSDAGADPGADLEADGGDPGPGDSPAGCQELPPAQLGLFERVFVTGASNTPDCQKAECGLASLQDHHGYYAKAVVAGYRRVQDCVEYEPVVALRDMSGALSLALSIDVFFHNTHGTVDDLVTAINQHMGEFRANYPEVPYIIPNVPELMITGSDDPAAYNQAFAEYADSDPHAWILDLDSAFGQVLAGKVTYNGQLLSPMDILVDAVHINELGHTLVAEWIILRLNQINPGLQIQPLGELVIAD